jgi:hypothetical protein
MTLTEKLARLRAKAKVSTQGPFSVERRDDDCGYMNYIVHGARGDYAWCRDELDGKARHNAALIASTSAPVILSLVDAVEAAEQMRAAYYLDGQTAPIPFDDALSALEKALADE